jgi:hypothetical protein
MKPKRIAVTVLLLVGLSVSWALAGPKAGPKIELITVWGKIKWLSAANTVLPGNMSLPGLPEGLKISLTGEGYSRTLTVSDALAGAFKKGKFEFPNVPCEKDMHLEITYPNSVGETMRWYGTFCFHKPPALPLIAKEKAGFVGNFRLDDSNPNNSQIKCSE